MNTERWLLVAIAGCVLAIVGVVYWTSANPRHTHCVTRASGELDCWTDREGTPDVR